MSSCVCPSGEHSWERLWDRRRMEWETVEGAPRIVVGPTLLDVCVHCGITVDGSERLVRGVLVPA